MHEWTRRLIVRMLFLALCLIPTLAIGAWAMVRRSPIGAHRRQLVWQERLSRVSGMRVRISAFMYAGALM